MTALCQSYLQPSRPCDRRLRRSGRALLPRPPANFSQLMAVGMSTTGAKGETPQAFVAPFRAEEGGRHTGLQNEVKRVIETGDPNTLIRNYLKHSTTRTPSSFWTGRQPISHPPSISAAPRLIVSKIKYLVATGDFKSDVPAAKKLFAEWPTPVYFVPREIGDAVPFPARASGKNLPKLTRTTR